MNCLNKLCFVSKISTESILNKSHWKMFFEMVIYVNFILLFLCSKTHPVSWHAHVIVFFQNKIWNHRIVKLYFILQLKYKAAYVFIDLSVKMQHSAPLIRSVALLPPSAFSLPHSAVLGECTDFTVLQCFLSLLKFSNFSLFQYFFKLVSFISTSHTFFSPTFMLPFSCVHFPLECAM